MPKPVLSDSLFNADDVATAVLNNANLQIANNSLGVTDVSDQYTIVGSFLTWHTLYAFKFMDFIFLNASTYQNNVGNASGNLWSMTSDVTPTNDYHCGTISHHGDTAEYIRIGSNGNISYSNMVDNSSSYWHVIINCWYRLT